MSKQGSEPCGNNSDVTDLSQSSPGGSGSSQQKSISTNKPNQREGTADKTVNGKLRKPPLKLYSSSYFFLLNFLDKARVSSNNRGEAPRKTTVSFTLICLC